MKRFAVVLEKAKSNWAYVPDLPGCITTSATLEESERKIREATELHVEAIREVSEPTPNRRATSISLTWKQ